MKKTILSLLLGIGVGLGILAVSAQSAVTNPIFFKYVGTAIVPIRSSSTLGIGTSTPTSKFDVDTGVTTNSTGINLSGSINSFLQYNCINRSTGNQGECGYSATANNGTATSGFMYMGINNSGFNSTSSYSIGSNLDTNLLSLSGDMYIANASSTRKMFFFTGGTGTSTSANNRMTITSTGNIGIATTSPVSTLSVAGTFLTTATSTVNGVDIKGNNTDFNVLLGTQAGLNLPSTAINNTFVGYQAGTASSTGVTNAADSNTGVGFQVLNKTTSGALNTALGDRSLTAVTSGGSNTALGGISLFTLTTGSNNTGVGVRSLLTTNGTGNVALGNNAGRYTTGSNEFYVNNQDLTTTGNEKIFSLMYGNFSGVASSTNGQFLTINGQLAVGTNTPSSNLHVTASSTNATSTMTLGKAGQTKGSCFELYDAGGSVKYVYIASGATTFTITTATCK